MMPGVEDLRSMQNARARRTGSPFPDGGPAGTELEAVRESWEDENT
jgi:hypothetical protein